MSGGPTTAEVEEAADSETKNNIPFFVWPWYLCTKDEPGQYMKGALMCLGMFGTAAGVKMCDEYPIWCLGSAGVALVCSVLAQREIYMSGNLKRIHHGLEKKNKFIAEDTVNLNWSMAKNKENVELVALCETNLEKEVTKLTEVAGHQQISTLGFMGRIDALQDQRSKMKDSFSAIRSTIYQIYGSDEKLEDELEVISQNLEDLQECEKEMLQDLENLRETYVNLCNSKERLAKELCAFRKMREMIESVGIKWTKNIVAMTETMKMKYKALFQLCMTFSTNFLKEIVHNCEYMDGKPGWTWDKFQELLRRLPNNIRAKADFSMMRQIFRTELLKVSGTKEAKLLGYRAVRFDVFEKEIVRKCLLPLCDVFTSGADNLSVHDTDESREMSEEPFITSAEVEF